MAKFAVPASPARSVVNIEHFKGVDLYNAPANVAINRSPDAPNMIRDEVGKVRKRMGFEDRTDRRPPTQAPPSAQLVEIFRGVHVAKFGEEERKIFIIGRAESVYLEGADRWLRYFYEEIHDGVKRVKLQTLASFLSGEVPSYYEPFYRRTNLMMFGGKAYIQTGNYFYVYDGETCSLVSDLAYIPTVMIGRAPSGGGTLYEAANLLSNAWTDSFLGTENDTEYQMSGKNLVSGPVKVQKLVESDWVELQEGEDFTVDLQNGVVAFLVAPGLSPVTGMDNVRITAKKHRYANETVDKINKSTIMTAYGVGGASERLFVGGNPAHPNIDWYSGFRDPTYFPDTGYTEIGQTDGEIVGYSVIGDKLATYRSGGQNGENIAIREGRLNDKGEAIFPIVNTIRGEGAVSKYAFATLDREPMFLTGRGVYGLTTEELTGERYGQLRSLYLGAELQGSGMDDACAVAWRDFYVLAANGKLYLLDGLQKAYDPEAPKSAYQMECYVWTGIDAKFLWVEDGALWFGTGAGRLCRFHTDVDDPRSYNDNGKAIMAYWDTPDLDGHLFFKNKTFRYVAVRLAAAVVTGVEIFAQVRGLWGKIFDAGERARYLDWSYIDFAKFVFSSDRTPRTLGGKVKLKKVDKARFRLQNDKHNEPFGLYAFAAEYTEPGNNFKG